MLWILEARLCEARIDDCPNLMVGTKRGLI